MIECPHCGKSVSDKAVFCPHCNERLIEEETIICPECGGTVPKSATVCPHCGAPLAKTEDPQKVELTKITAPSIDPKTKKTALIAAACIAVLLGVLFLGRSILKNQQAAKWQETYDSACSSMYSGAVIAEGEASLIHDIWYNTIFHEYDTKTNKYTFKSKYRDDSYETERRGWATKDHYNDDFNDSLSYYFITSEHTSTSTVLRSNKTDVDSYMSELANNVPEGKENAYNAISDLYDQYLGLTNLALNPTGNLTSYTSSFNQYDDGFVKAYTKAKAFIGQ